MQIEEVIERLKSDITKPLYYGEQTIVNIEDLDTVLNELEKKDKVIDEMAELIVRKTGSRIEICHNMNCDKTIEKECKYCAKEYFYEKVSDNK